MGDIDRPHIREGFGQKRLSRDIFLQNDFDQREFIDSLLTKQLREAAEADKGNLFNPRPYIRQFESALKDINRIRADTVNDLRELRTESKTLERVHQERMQGISQKLKDLEIQFSVLENVVAESSRTAHELGDTLSKADRERQQLLDKRALSEVFFELAQGETQRLENLRLHSGLEGKSQCAAILKQLFEILPDVKLKRVDRIRKDLEHIRELLTQSLLDDFQRALKNSNTRHLSKSAAILFNLDERAQITAQFFNSLECFTIQDVVESDKHLSDSILERLKDTNEVYNPRNPEMEHLFDSAKATVAEQIPLITRIFPMPHLVLKDFLQRLFAQKIQLQVEDRIHDTEKTSTLAILRAIHGLHIALAEFGEVVKSLIAKESIAEADKLAVQSAVDQLIEDLFVPYLKDSKYVELELKSLHELFSEVMNSFNIYHSKRRSFRTEGFFDKLKKQVGNRDNADYDSDGPSRLASIRSNVGLDRQFSERTRKKTRSLDSSDFESFTEQSSGMISAQTVRKMLFWHAEAVGRAIELSGPELNASMKALLDFLSETLLINYIDVSIEVETATCNRYDGKSEPDVSCISSLQPIALSLKFVQNHFEAVLEPVFLSTVDMHPDTLSDYHDTWNLIERNLNNLLRQIFINSRDWINFCLQRQRKSDFRDADTHTSGKEQCTAPVVAIISFLNQLKGQAAIGLDGNNYVRFITELGMSISKQFFEHYKKFPVSERGAPILMRDIDALNNFFQSWSIDLLSSRFSVLHSLGKLMTVRPDQISNILNESSLARFDRRDLDLYIMKREDNHLLRI